jgi:hypothetical protein
MGGIVVKFYLSQLYGIEACSNQIELIQSIFPDGTDMTSQGIMKAHNDNIQILWSVRLLPQEGENSQKQFVNWCLDRIVDIDNSYRDKAETEKTKTQNPFFTVRVADFCRRAIADASGVEDEDERRNIMQEELTKQVEYLGSIFDAIL